MGVLLKNLVVLLLLIAMLMRIFWCWITPGCFLPGKGDGLHSPLTNWWCIFIELQEVRAVQSWQVCLNKIILCEERHERSCNPFVIKHKARGFSQCFLVLHKTCQGRSGLIKWVWGWNLLGWSCSIISWGLNVFCAQWWNLKQGLHRQCPPSPDGDTVTLRGDWAHPFQWGPAPSIRLGVLGFPPNLPVSSVSTPASFSLISRWSPQYPGSPSTVLLKPKELGKILSIWCFKITYLSVPLYIPCI